MGCNSLKITLTVIIVVASLFLLVFSFLLYDQSLQINKLNNQIKDINANYNKLNIQYANLAENYEIVKGLNTEIQKQNQMYRSELITLQQKYVDLNSQYATLYTQYTTTKDTSAQLARDVNALLSKIDTYKSELQTSMAWFKDNALLPDTDLFLYARSYISTGCIKVTGDTCTVLSGCFNLTNTIRLGLTYKIDNPLENKGDRLLGLEEFVRNKGGDCEDYALFYKAEFNYALKKCQEKGATSVKIDAFVPGSQTDKYWANVTRTWYLPREKQIFIKKGYIYPVVLCYVNIDTNIGHCIIAYTKSKISKIEDINSLLSNDNPPLVEPQTGAFLGYLNLASSGVYMPNYANSQYTVERIITDSDLFLYDEKERQWIGYKYFYNQLVQLEQVVGATRRTSRASTVPTGAREA